MPNNTSCWLESSPTIRRVDCGFTVELQAALLLAARPVFFRTAAPWIKGNDGCQCRPFRYGVSDSTGREARRIGPVPFRTALCKRPGNWAEPAAGTDLVSRSGRWGIRARSMCPWQQIWEKAAKKGDAEPQHNLGNIFYNGLGVDRDVIRTESLYRQACRAGCGRGEIYTGPDVCARRGARNRLCRGAHVVQDFRCDRQPRQRGESKIRGNAHVRRPDRRHPAGRL